MKRIRLFLLLSLLTLSITTNAWTDTAGRTFTTYTDTHYPAQTFAKLTGFTGTELVVPKTTTYNGTTYSVAAIGTFTGNTKITSVTFESGLINLTSASQMYGFVIPAKCFQNCTALKEVQLNKNSTEIKDYAFDGCTALESVYNAQNNSKIGNYAFRNCKKLSNFSNGINGNGTWWIGSYAFQNCTLLANYNIPWTVKDDRAQYIGEGAFMKSGLKYIVIPMSLQRIPKKMCYQCDSLTRFDILQKDAKDPDTEADDVDITNALAEIGDSAFMNCPNVNMGMGWLTHKEGENLWTYWWWYTRSGALLETKHNLAKIGKHAFANSGMSAGIYLPNTLGEIGEGAFYGCRNMSFVNFENATNLTIIGKECFQYCSSLGRTYGLGNTKLTAIPDYAFANCGKFWIDGDTLNHKITTIGAHAFEFDTTIGYLELDATTTSIGDYAFSNCQALKGFTIPSGNKLTTIGAGAFWNCYSLKTLEFPANSPLTTIGESAFGICKALKSNFQSLVNTKLKTVGPRAFVDCINLDHIYFPSTIQQIGGTRMKAGEVFANDTSLISITIPSGGNSYYTAKVGAPLVTKDGKTLICYPAKHTTVTGTNPLTDDYINGYLLPAAIDTISNYAFQGCQDIHFVLPKTVKYIGSNSFAKCSKMTEIAIPDNVTTISSYVFDGCSNLQSIYFLPRTVPGHSGSYSFNGLSSKVTAYVKTAYLSDYSKSFGSSLFKTVTNIVPYSTSSTKTYQTRCFDFDADFSSAVNGNKVKIWAITGFNSSTGKVTWAAKADGYIPARKDNNNNQASYNGVLIQCLSGTSGITFQIGDNSAPTNFSTNYLVGCPGTHWAYGSSYTAAPTRLYGLQDGKFKLYSKAGRIPYNRAYLDGAAAGIPANYKAEIEWVFFEEDGSDVTAIEKLEAGVTETKENGAYYNLNGVKVENPTKGVYIHNGKKVVIK